MFLGDISFYLVLELVSSFSSRSYTSFRRCTDHSGMNMSTNMELKTRTRCYSFDQAVRKCNYRLVVNMIVKDVITFPYGRVATVLLLLCQTSCPPTATARAGLTRCGAKTRDQRREGTLLLLLMFLSGAAVAVMWAHARTQELCL